jgi:hypothetical protein
MYLRVPSPRELPGWDKNRFRLRDSELECAGLGDCRYDVGVVAPKEVFEGIHRIDK